MTPGSDNTGQEQGAETPDLLTLDDEEGDALDISTLMRPGWRLAQTDE